MRFGWGSVISFAWDEARISLDALSMARGGTFVMAGQPSSVDVPFFPASVWAFVPPFLISPDPLTAARYVALLNLLTVFGVWAWARRWGAAAGLAAALFMAAQPYAVLYGRSVWQPNLLAPLALAWAWAAERGARGRAWGIGACVALGGLGIQFHFAGAALALGTVYAALRWRWWRRPLPVLIGIGAAAVCVLPYLYYAAVLAPGTLERFFAAAGGSASYDLTSFENALRLGVGTRWAYIGIGDLDTFSQGIGTALMAAGLWMLGALGLARSPLDPTREVALVLLFTSPLFFIRHSSPVLPHYQLISLPAFALLVGLAVTLVKRRIWAAFILSVTAVLALVWTGQIVTTLTTAERIRPFQTALASIDDEPRRAIAAAPDDRLLIVLAHGDTPALHGEAAVFAALLWERPHRIIDGETLLVLPSEPSALLASLAPFQAWEELVAAGLTDNAISIPRRERAEAFELALYNGQPLDGYTALEAPVEWVDGTMLTAWRARRVGERFRISTVWRKTEHESGLVDVQQFHHLRRADAPDGEPLLISDVSLSFETWRAGDTVIVMADFFDVPDGEYTVDIGHYTLADVARIPRLNRTDSFRLPVRAG